MARAVFRIMAHIGKDVAARELATAIRTANNSAKHEHEKTVSIEKKRTLLRWTGSTPDIQAAVSTRNKKADERTKRPNQNSTKCSSYIETGRASSASRQEQRKDNANIHEKRRTQMCRAEESPGKTVNERYETRGEVCDDETIASREEQNTSNNVIL